MINCNGTDMTGSIAGRVIDCGDIRNSIGRVGMKKIHIRRPECVEMCCSPEACPVVATRAGLTGINVDETGMPCTIMLPLAVGPYVAGRGIPVRRCIMTGNATA